MSRIMRPQDSTPEIFLYRQPVDFRKSYRGLGAIVELELGYNPFNGSLYVFINRQHNKIKCLFWETNGFVLYYKSLSEEKFKWPSMDNDVISLTGQQVNWLLDGYDISAMKPHKKLNYHSLF